MMAELSIPDDYPILTTSLLDDISPGIFRTGLAPLPYHEGDDPLACAWVATRGYGYGDWAIYFAPSFWNFDKVKSDGKKLTEEKLIRELVPCETDAFERYRY